MFTWKHLDGYLNPGPYYNALRQGWEHISTEYLIDPGCLIRHLS